MKIGVDATCWGNRRGFGRFTRELLSALLEIDQSNDYLFFVDRDSTEAEQLPARSTKVLVNTRLSQIEAASADSSRSLRDLWAMTDAVRRHRMDAFFFPAVYSFFPILNRTKLVVTLHDVIADHNPDLVFPNLKSKLFWKLKQRVAVHQADVVATVSEYSRRQIANYYDIEESQIRVISEGARADFRVLEAGNETAETLKRYGLGATDAFLLYVGGISPHKNLTRLVQAFETIARESPDIKLVLVGDFKDDPFFSAYPELKSIVAKLGLEARVIFTGFIPDLELARFYNAATLLVFPSLEEGFGLPAIEAMSCGTPVAASNCSSLPEVLGDAGCFFDPLDTENIAGTVLSILQNDDVRRTMREKGLKRAERFLWKNAASDLLAVFNELVADAPRGRNGS